MITSRFGYGCPNMFNEAEFVISILNSDNEHVKKNVDKMCKLSSSEQQTDINYNLLIINVSLLFLNRSIISSNFTTYMLM